MTIDWQPTDEAAEIAQNVRYCLLPRASIPFQRRMGIGLAVDQPMIAARAAVTTETIESIERYEPRARVRRVRFDQASIDEMNGTLLPVVEYERRDA